MWPIHLINSALNIWSFAEHQIYEALQKNLEEFSGHGWELVGALCSSLKYISFALMVLFFGIGLIKQITRIEDLKRPETVFRLFCRFIMARTIVVYATDILLAITKIGTGIVTKLCESFSNDLHYYDMGDFISDYKVLKDNVMAASWYEDIPIGIFAVIGFVIIAVLSIVALMTVYGRFFKMYVWAAVAPIPLASLASEGTASVGWQYLKGFIGICFEAAIIIVAMRLFVVLGNDIPFSLTHNGYVSHFAVSVAVIVFRMLLMIGIIKSSSNIVKEMTGLY